MIVNQKKVVDFSHFALFILLILLYGCGSESETGSISFSIELQSATTEGLDRHATVLDCAASGVSTVEGTVYDENDSFLTDGGPWNCDDHSGTITGVPVGSDRRVAILGKDSSGNILYRGEVTSITVTADQITDAGIITLAPMQWVRLLGTSGNDTSCGAAVDSDGNIYITGYTGGDLDGNTNAGEYDIFVAKYDTNGDKKWTELLGTLENEVGYGIAVDSNNNVSITGWTQGDLAGNTNAGGWDIFVAMYDPNGYIQWTKLLGTSDFDEGHGIAMDSDGNIYVTGVTQSDILFAKYNASGSRQWSGSSSTSEYECGRGIAVDSNGDIYITGGTWGDLDGKANEGRNDIFITKLNAGHGKQWTELLGTEDEDEGKGIAVDSNGDIYITGGTWGDLDGNTNSGGSDIFVSKYDTNGNKMWTELLGTAYDEYGLGIAVDSDGNLYITGHTWGDLDGKANTGKADIFVLKYDADGVKQWTEILGTRSVYSDMGTGIAVDSNGNVIITGSTEGDLDGNINAGAEDIFIWKLVDHSM